MIQDILVGIVLVHIITASKVGEQSSLAVTIYNDQFAMVKDIRNFELDQGKSSVYFTDVSGKIQTETVTFKALENAQNVKVYEQNFDSNLVNKQSILQKYIEKQVLLFVTLGDEFRKAKGKLLGYKNGYILETSSGINVFNQIDGIEFVKLPQGFFTSPTLSWSVFTTKAVKSDCEVAYRTKGFSWKADYSVVLNDKEDKIDVGGWVTIDNKSGKKYTNAKLKLIAGDVKTVSSTTYYATRVYANQMDGSASFEEKSFADYHLYTLSELVTVNQSSQKQVEFMSKVYEVKIDKYYEININSGYYSQQNLKAATIVSFNNSQDNKLGVPFPKGIVRVFKEDTADKSLEFVGEDRIQHTPKDQMIKLQLGNAFDITVQKKSTEYKKIGTNGYTAKSTIIIKNHKESSIKVVINLNRYSQPLLKVNWEDKLNFQEDSTRHSRFNAMIESNQQFTTSWVQRKQSS